MIDLPVRKQTLCKKKKKKKKKEKEKEVKSMELFSDELYEHMQPSL